MIMSDDLAGIEKLALLQLILASKDRKPAFWDYD